MADTRTPGWTIQKARRNGPAPLSFPQERLFLLDRIMPGLPAYNIPSYFRVHATLDPDVLRQACRQIIERHEVLRTTIRLLDGTPVQEVSENPPFELTVVDLRSRPEDEREPEAERQFAELARRPFDLGHDVLLRVALAHIGPDQDLLLVVVHHIGSDHATRKLFLDELDAIYTALSQGTEAELPELPVQYADYAAWQREQISGARLDDLLAYWTTKLAGAPERLDLPTDRPRPNTQSYHGALREFTLESELAAALRQRAREARGTLFMVLLAGFKALLQRYAGTQDVVVGTPISGRSQPEIAKLLGFFTNTLALRTDLSGDPTFTDLLTRVKSAVIEAQVHRELPFERLVEAINPQRTESHSPIFQVMFGFDVVSAEEHTIAGGTVELLPVPGWEFARLDLSLVVRERPDGSLFGRIEYSKDLFDEATIDRMIGHLRTLLESVSSDPARHLSQLSILTEAEQRQILVDWNETSRPYERRCVHELVSAQAARTPDAVAVVAAEGRSTYGELERRSNQLAHELMANGVGTGTLVGICAERGIEMVVALLGTLKSGAAYVPIDPTYPPQRQELMLADSEARVLLTQERFLGMLDPGQATVYCLDRDWPRIEQRSVEPVTGAADPGQLAYVIYTSGSTGRPKGVEISHRALVNFLISMREEPGLDQDDVLLAVTTLSFDIAGLELYLPLLVGARVVITPLEATMDGVELADWLARSSCTFMQATPTTWQLLVDAGWQGSPGMRIACGGEALPRSLANQLLERCSSLWQMYGPTETTIWSSVLRLTPGDGAPALGGPIANTSFFVLDEHRQPVPVGVPGELHIGGDGVAEGYHNRPELTRERFIPDPFGPRNGRLYRTGDLVRWRDNGTLEFLGRIDQQVKLRGFRIELEEIEAVLGDQAGVRTAVATVREDVPGDKRLVAYILPREGHNPEVEALRGALKVKLPPYMVPSAFVILDTLPSTPNGKLDRRALPAPDGARPRLEAVYAPPESPVEQAVASIWSDVLVVDRIGLDDDFFDIGGHSLLALKMLARIQEGLSVELPLRRLFEGATVRELSAALTAEMLGDAVDDELATLLAEVEASER